MRVLLFLVALMVALTAHAEVKNTPAKKTNVASGMKRPVKKPLILQPPARALDLTLEQKPVVEELKKDTPPPNIDSNLVLDQRRRGDIKVTPEFKYVEDSDVTKSNKLEQEKEFKLQFNIGL